MMLRESTDALPPRALETDVDAPRRRLLLESFVAAVTGDDVDTADRARTALADAYGHEWLVDAAAVVANFEMMTRLADGTGARLTSSRLDATAAMRIELGLDKLTSGRT